jgi:hypothetical protein
LTLLAQLLSSTPAETSARFTLRTYVHLMDDGVGDAAFMDEVGKGWATQHPEIHHAQQVLDQTETAA